MGRKILVVDDEKNIVDVVAFNLHKEGYEVVVARDGESCLAAFAKEKPDLVLLDIKLENNPVTGLDLLQTIRATDTELPVILSTAYDSFQHDLKSIAADAYNVKSVDLTGLKDTIKTVLAQKKA